MNTHIYNIFRIAITFFVGLLVSFSVIQDNYMLAIAGVLTAMLFLFLFRVKAKIKVDEREEAVKEKSARMTYLIFSPTIACGALLLLFPSKSGAWIFQHGEWLFFETLGTIFAYLSLFLIVLYAISYHYFNSKFGGGNEE